MNIEKQILNQFINNIPQFVFWKDRNSVYIGCNDNFANYAGLKSREEVVGKTDYDMPWSREEADFFRKIDQEVMESGEAQINFEEPQTLESGEKRWLSTSKMPLFDEDKKVIGIMGWYIDITEYKQMEIQMDEKNRVIFEYNIQLQNSKKALELANYDLEKFTYAASHDLKEPLRTILIFSQLIKSQQNENLEKKYVEYLDFIINSSVRMMNLIKDILLYARTGKQEGSCTQVNLSELVSNKILDLKQLIDLKSANIILELPVIPVKCYQNLIGLVFYNLIHNAIKFNESETPTVKCISVELPDHWEFSIVDNGIGIDTEYAKTIFEPFKRLVSTEYEGSGIGLSICNRIIDIHKGNIWIENNPPSGTCFKFTISKEL